MIRLASTLKSASPCALLVALTLLSSTAVAAAEASPKAALLVETQLVLPRLVAKIESRFQDAGFEVRAASETRAALAFLGGSSPTDDATCQKLRAELSLDRLVVVASREAEDTIFVSVRLVQEARLSAHYAETTAEEFDETVLELIAKLVPPAENPVAVETPVMGSLDPADIDARIKKSLNPIKACYDKELYRSPRLAGKLVVNFTIQPDGKVSQARVKSSTLENSNVESCITARFLKIRFPKPNGGGIVNVNYPLLFSSSNSPAEEPTPTPMYRVTLNADGTESFEEVKGVVPKAIFQASPAYPALARNKNITGTVKLDIVVAESGYVRDVTLLSGDSVFDASALEAVKKWRYEPVLVDGEPIVWKSKVTLSFQLR